MTMRRSAASMIILAAFACSAGTASGEGQTNYVDGVSQIWVPTSEEYPAGIKLFDPTHAYATRSSNPARVWLLITDRDASDVQWQKSRDRTDVLRAWCKNETASFVLFEFDTQGVPERVYECGGGGALGSELISTLNGLDSVSPAFEVFDDQRIRGRIRGGKGWCGEDTYCEKTRLFTVDVEVTR